MKIFLGMFFFRQRAPKQPRYSSSQITAIENLVEDTKYCNWLEPYRSYIVSTAKAFSDRPKLVTIGATKLSPDSSKAEIHYSRKACLALAWALREFSKRSVEEERRYRSLINVTDRILQSM